MSNSVAIRSKESEAMVSACAKGRALMGGTEAMRAAGETHLPKFPAEDREAYNARLGASWLFNGYRKTVRDMSGRVFSKSVELGDGSTPRVVDWCENVDLAGRDLSTFSRDVFEDGIDAGISYIFVDAPPRSGVVTQAQAAMQNLRPYMIHLSVESILGWKSEAINNAQTLTQLRIMETISEQNPKDEFSQIEVKQVRVLDRTDAGVQTRLYRQVEAVNKAGEWELFGEPTISGLTEITVVPFYANRAGFFKAKPLLDDLADVNIAHWQSQSDQRNILHFARVPILFAAGRPEEDGPLVISAGMATVSSNPDAKLEWVEHSGSAIGAGRQDLKDLEFQMEAHGLQLLVAQSQSATGATLDAAKETSILAMTADALKDTLEQALIWMAQYGGLDASVEVKVNKEFGAGMMTAQELQLLLTAVNTGQLSRETFLNELARRGMVQPDLNIADEVERIQDEGGDSLGMNDGGQ